MEEEPSLCFLEEDSSAGSCMEDDEDDNRRYLQEQSRRLVDPFGSTDYGSWMIAI